MTPKPIAPEKIRAIRAALEETQREFAERLGVDPITVSRWERGESSPKSRIVLAALVEAAAMIPHIRPAGLTKKGFRKKLK